LGSYGRPRTTEDLKHIGLDVGHRGVGRLMRQNGFSIVRTRKHKVTMDSDHKILNLFCDCINFLGKLLFSIRWLHRNLTALT
jgi:hypothetical protein